MENSPFLFGDFDAAELCLITFFVFFAGLIVYLRREDRREGYPLENDVTGQHEPLGGLLFTAKPKTFLLPHGHGTRVLPRADNRDTRPLAARRSAPTDGSPLEPTGNPLLDGVGPGGYAERPNYADLTIDGHARIVPMRVAPDFHIPREDTDPRGLAVLGCDGLKGGEVSDVWVDRSEQLIRYLEVAVGTRKVLLPMQMCIIDGGARAVKVRAITSAQFADVPTTASPEQVTLLEEEKIIGYYGGGHLYATRDRQEPWL